MLRVAHPLTESERCQAPGVLESPQRTMWCRESMTRVRGTFCVPPSRQSLAAGLGLNEKGTHTDFCAQHPWHNYDRRLHRKRSYLGTRLSDPVGGAFFVLP